MTISRPPHTALRTQGLDTRAMPPGFAAPPEPRRRRHSLARRASALVVAWWSALLLIAGVLTGLPFSPARADTAPVPAAVDDGYGGAIRLLDGGIAEDGGRMAGLLIELPPGWKTYWREPGLSGLPPDLTAGGANVGAVEWLWPTPRRLKDPFGDAIGYEGRTMLPLRVMPADAAAPVTLRVSGLLGVCEAVCVPREIDLILTLEGTEGDPRVARAVGRVPREAAVPVAAMHEADRLTVTLDGPAEDAFLFGPLAGSGLGTRLSETQFAFDLAPAADGDDGLPHGLVVLRPGAAVQHPVVLP